MATPNFCRPNEMHHNLKIVLKKINKNKETHITYKKISLVIQLRFTGSDCLSMSQSGEFRQHIQELISLPSTYIIIY